MPSSDIELFSVEQGTVRTVKMIFRIVDCFGDLDPQQSICLHIKTTDDGKKSLKNISKLI